MKKIEELNFTRSIYNFLKLNNINTLEDIKQIDYNIIKYNKDVYNALVSRLHSEKMLFNFEIPFYEVIKQRIINNDYIKIEELTISAHTKAALNKLNINYVDELVYLDKESLNKLRNNELGEVLYLLEMFNIKLSANYNDKLKILNQKLEELILSDNTIFELKALGCSTVSDYVHKIKNKNIQYYLSISVINEIDNQISDYLINNEQSIELVIKDYQIENNKLNNINKKRQENLLKLELLKKERERLLEESKKIEEDFNKVIK